MGSRSQSPCGTRFPAKKTGSLYGYYHELLAGWPGYKTLDDHKFVDIILDLFWWYTNFSENFVFDPKSFSCPFLNPFQVGSTQIWSYKQDVDPKKIIHDLQKILMRTPLGRDRCLQISANARVIWLCALARPWVGTRVPVAVKFAIIGVGEPN